MKLILNLISGERAFLSTMENNIIHFVNKI